MKPFIAILLAAALPVTAFAADGARDGDAGAARLEAEAAEVPEEEQVAGLRTIDGTEADLASFQWVERLIVVFADTPENPDFQEQMAYLEERVEDLVDRDVVVVVDTDPAAQSAPRRELRPRGFMVVIIDKDGEVKLRRPSPRSGRELVRSIDSFTLR